MKYIPWILITVVLTVIVYVTQIAALAAGFDVWFGIPPVLTYIVAFLIGWIPPFGSIIATAAATEVWGWSWAYAIFVFFGIYLWYGLLGMLGVLEVFKGVKWARARLNEKRKAPIIIDQNGNDVIL